MIKHVQKEKSFYFSYDIDLTKNMQKTLEDIQTNDYNNLLGGQNMATKSGATLQSLVMMREAYPNSVDYIPRYAFNEMLLHEFQGIEYSPFRVPCIFGYVFISSPQIKISQKTNFYLISRKDFRRTGRRFIVRGLDSQGNAANFVETEHIFVHNKPDGTHSVASYVQIRGSITLIWSMKPNLKWSPPVKVQSNF